MVSSLTRRQIVLAGAAAPLGWLTGCRENAASSSAPAPVVRTREATVVLPSRATMDGAGVRLRRALGHVALDMLDPFLLLDEFRSDSADDYIRGFPDHPHRGFETVTYMLQGAMEHRDSMGNHGRLGPGSIQWMTAGRGIIHSEMPKQVSGLMWGYQLWVNLPARLKMTQPRYQDIVPQAVPEVDGGQARVRVLAGEFGGTRGPVRDIYTEPLMLDVELRSGAVFSHALPADHNAFVYSVSGNARVGARGTSVARGEIAVLGGGDDVQLAADSEPSRVLLLAGRPLREPVVRRGPFVMNTEAELQRAFDDYRSGRLVQG